MAFQEYDDYEQGEIVQRWLRQNGVSIIVGVAIGLIVIFGWQAWRRHQTTNNAQAAQVYSQARGAEAAGNTAKVDLLTGELQRDYPHSAYAVFAMADQARIQVAAGKFDAALKSLGWAVEHAPDDGLKSLMQLRVAKVQFAAGRSRDALATLAKLDPQQYMGMRDELRGDVLAKLGQQGEARQAYQAALVALGGEAPQRASLQLKIDDLAVAGKQGA